MNKLAPSPFRHAVALAVALLAAAAPPAQAQQVVNPQTDEVILSNLESFQRQQAVLRRLNESGRHRLASYSLAKAQCWLDTSFHEYTRNDSSIYATAAFDESVRISNYLFSGEKPERPANPAWQTPLIGEAVKLREDLWRQAAELRKARGWSCAQRQTACAEVELVHAGNEHQQFGWRHAQPYIQIAEDLIAEAVALEQDCPVSNRGEEVCKTDTCKPQILVKTCTVTKAPSAPLKNPLDFTIHAGFEFNQGTREHIKRLDIGRGEEGNTAVRATPGKPLSFEQEMNQVVQDINAAYSSIRKVEVYGHTDRLGPKALNERLSRQRADTVLQILRLQGIRAESFEAIGKGSSEPLPEVSCPGSRETPELIACLAPNRRVVVRIDGVRQPLPHELSSLGGEEVRQCSEPVPEKP